jgi:Prokaryotic metallothionein
LLLRLILIFLICYILFSALRTRSNGRKVRAAKRPNFAGDSEEMVLDPQCRSYVPRSEAIEKSGRYFCSEECARLYLTR